MTIENINNFFKSILAYYQFNYISNILMQLSRIIMRNFNKHYYFLQFHRSSILNNNSFRPFCIFLLKNSKTTNLQIQLEQQLNCSSSFSTFHRLNQTSHIDELLKRRAKRNFSIKKFSTIGKEHSEKHENVTFGIETMEYTAKNGSELLVIKMCHNENGDKWIHLCQKLPFANFNFPNIPLPKDAYLWVKAMDSLMLMAKVADQGKNHPNCGIVIKGSLPYDYKVGIGASQKDCPLEFTLETITKKSQIKASKMFLPIQLLPFLRDRIAKMLVEFDGTQQIGPSQSSLPKWMEEHDKTASEDANKLQNALIYRDTLEYKLDDEPEDRKIQIEYWRGESDKEHIKITQAFDKRMDTDNAKADVEHLKFSHIPIQDAQPLLNAMEIMANDLLKQPPIYQNQSSIICHQLVKGLDFNYKMEIHSTENKQMDFRIILLNTDKLDMNLSSKFDGPFPIEIFHWLKEQMAEILLVSSSSPASNKLAQPLKIVDEKQETKPNLLRSNYRVKEKILHVEKLPYIDYYEEKENTMFVFIEMHQNWNGKKSIFLYKWLHFTPHKFVHIYVPEDAYSMIKTMDELMRKLRNMNFFHPPNSPVFERVNGGLKYDYRIGIRLNPKLSGHLEFMMETIATIANSTHKPKEIFTPVGMLPLLRDRMAKMLVKFDGTKQIGPSPSPLPKWIIEEDNIYQNVLTRSGEAVREQWETVRQETLNYSAIVNLLNEKQDKQIKIELKRNKLGEEFIQIVEKFKQLKSTNIGEEEDKSLFVYFLPIPIKIAYHLLDAMHKLSNEWMEKYSAFEISDGTRYINDLAICQQRVNGLGYDYKLEIKISPITKQLEFKLVTITTSDLKHKQKKLYGPIPMKVFKWLQDKMAELLKSSSNQQGQNINDLEKLESDEDVDGKDPIIYREEEEANKVFEAPIRCKLKEYRLDDDDDDEPQDPITSKEEANNEILIRFESKDYIVDIEPQNRQIQIKLQQGKSGKKFIEIVQRYFEKESVSHFYNFSNIPLPEDAYPFLDAMRTVSKELEEKRTAFLNGDYKSSMICQQIVKGLNYDYKLEIHSCKNQQLDFRLQTISKADIRHKPRKLRGPIPIHIFNWMKETMAEILANYGEIDRNEEKRKN